MPLREEKKIKLRTVVTVGLVLLVVTVWLVWWKWDPVMDRLCRPRIEADMTRAAADAAAAELDSDFIATPGEWEVALAEAESRWTEWAGVAPTWPEPFAAPTDCAAVEDDLARICRRLDETSPLFGTEAAGGSCRLIGQVVEELMQNPPSPTSELRSYQAMLGNMFHLFRTVGRKRLGLLREAGREEEANAEVVAMAFYRWLVSRETCSRSGRTAIRAEALYDYASFAFQTMGGQAYLRRRPPRTEALASFYALLILDRALEQDLNPQGVDPRAEIRRTRELLGAQPLVFGDRYRALLDEMDERWQPREP